VVVTSELQHVFTRNEYYYFIIVKAGRLSLFDGVRKCAYRLGRAAG
jgi:hypothetical protein